MHILMATTEALDISADDLVLNRTTLQKIREKNRHDQFYEAKSDTIDKVIYYKFIFKLRFQIYTFLYYFYRLNS